MPFNETHRPSDAHSGHARMKTAPNQLDSFLRSLISEKKRPASQEENEIPVDEYGKPLAKLQLNPKREFLRGGMQRGDQARTSGGSWEMDSNNYSNEWLAIRNYEPLLKFNCPDDRTEFGEFEEEEYYRQNLRGDARYSVRCVDDANYQEKFDSYVKRDEFKDLSPFLTDLNKELHFKSQYTLAENFNVLTALMEFNAISLLNDLKKLGKSDSIPLLHAMHQLMEKLTDRFLFWRNDTPRISEMDHKMDHQLFRLQANLTYKIREIKQNDELKKLPMERLNYMIQVVTLASYRNIIICWDKKHNYDWDVNLENVTNEARNDLLFYLAYGHHLAAGWCLKFPSSEQIEKMGERESKAYCEVPKDIAVIHSNISIALNFEGQHHYELVHLRAQGLEAMGRYEDALKDCNKVMSELKPKHYFNTYEGPIFKTYAILQNRLGNENIAKDYLKKAINQGDELYLNKLKNEEFLKSKWLEDKNQILNQIRDQILEMIETLDKSEHPQRDAPTASSSEERQKLQQEFDRQLNEAKKKHEEELKQEQNKRFALNIQLENAKMDRDKAYKERDQAQAQVRKAERERDQAQAQVRKAERERDQAQAQVRKVERERDQAWAQLSEVKQERDQAWAQLSEVKQERDQAWAQLSEVQQELWQIQTKEIKWDQQRHGIIKLLFDERGQSSRDDLRVDDPLPVTLEYRYNKLEQARTALRYSRERGSELSNLLERQSGREREIQQESQAKELELRKSIEGELEKLQGNLSKNERLRSLLRLRIGNLIQDHYPQKGTLTTKQDENLLIEKLRGLHVDVLSNHANFDIEPQTIAQELLSQVQQQMENQELPGGVIKKAMEDLYNLAKQMGLFK